MKCKGTKVDISLLLDSDLPENDRDNAMHHLSLCPACRVRYDQLSLIKSVLPLPDQDVPEGFRAGWQSRLEKAQVPRRFAPVLKVLVPVAVAAVCGIFILSSSLGAQTGGNLPNQAAVYSVQQDAVAEATHAPESSARTSQDEQAAPAEAESFATDEEEAFAADQAPNQEAATGAGSQSSMQPASLDLSGQASRDDILSVATRYGIDYSEEGNRITLTAPPDTLAQALNDLGAGADVDLQTGSVILYY